MRKYTTVSGRVYVVDHEKSWWARWTRSGTNVEACERLNAIGAGKSISWPWEKPEDWDQGRAPEVGENLYVSSLNLWYVSQEVVSIEDVVNLFPEKESHRRREDNWLQLTEPDQEKGH